MSKTAEWIISGVLFFLVAYFFFRVYKKGETPTSNSYRGTTGGSGSGNVKDSKKE